MQKNILEKFSYHVADLSSSTQEAYVGDTRAFLSFLKDLTLAEITDKDVSRFIAKRERDGYSVASILRTISSLKVFSRFLDSVKGGQGFDIPRSLIPKKLATKIPILKDHEITNLLYVAVDSPYVSARNTLIIKFFVTLALKASEVVDLQLKDFHASQKLLVVGKRHVDLSPDLIQQLTKYVKDTRPKINVHSKYLFPSKRAEALSRKSVWRMVSDYGKRAKLHTRVTPSMLRHTCVKNFVSEGAGMSDLGLMLGYKDMYSAGRYISEFS